MSHSVMIGFLTGVAVNIVLGQLQDLTGSDRAVGSVSLPKGLDVLLHPGHWDLPSLAAGLVALALLVGLARTRLASVSALLALVVPTVAAVVLVQGAGVAESARNPDGARAEADRDFAAQGLANVAAGGLGGMVVGGSIGQTALNRSAGARSRWGAIAAGLWMLLIVAALAPTMGRVVVPPLAAVLVFAAGGAIRFREAQVVLRTGTISRVAIVSTFTATRFLPVAAVGLGVVVSLLLQIDREALDLAVVELTVVVLRLRGRTVLGATGFLVLARFAERMAEGGGRLDVSGVDPRLLDQFARSGRHRVDGPVRLYEATPTIGESSRHALADAEAWLLRHGQG